MQQWVVGAADAGARLDKFLADPDRLRSRARALAALGRGKVFLNDRESTSRDAAHRLSAGDVIRLWIDRPGSAKKRPTLGDDHDLPIVFEDAPSKIPTPASPFPRGDVPAAFNPIVLPWTTVRLAVSLI